MTAEKNEADNSAAPPAVLGFVLETSLLPEAVVLGALLLPVELVLATFLVVLVLGASAFDELVRGFVGAVARLQKFLSKGRRPTKFPGGE